MNFSADPSLFAAAQSSLSDALDNVSNAKNTIASLESYPTGYEYTAEVSSSLSNLSKVFTELYQLERKVIRAKDDLVKLDSGWGALYYQVLSSKMDDFMGPLTEEQVYEQETNFDLLVKYADEMFSNEIFKTDPSTWNEEQIKIYLEMLPYIKQVAPYIQNKVDEKTIEKQNINNVNKQILEEKKARYNELIKTFPSSKEVKELEKEITSLEKEIANYEIPLQYGELDSEALKKIRDDLEKNIKEGVFRSFTLSGEEKLEQKSLTAQINVLNQLILYKERVEYFNDLDSQYVNDLDREAKIAAGKERSKHMDANGSKATFAYDEEHILAGFGDSWCFERYMSDEDKEKYYYVLGCNDTFDELGFYEGYDAGLEYLSWFEQSVNDAWGKELGEAQVRAYNNANFIGKAWMTTTTSAQQGLSSAFSGISAATDAFLGYDVNTTISGTDIAASEFRDNLGYWGQKAYDINQTTWNMVPAMSFARIIPGSAAAIIFSQSYGNNYAEMKRNGYTDSQAHAYSRDAALAEALLESATSSVPGIGWFTQSGAKTYSKLAVDVVEDLVKDAAGEVVQDMTTRYMGNEYLLQENDLSWFTKENLDTFLVSLGSSILMGGASKVNDAVNIADSRAQIEQYVYSVTGSEVSYKNLMEMINNNQTDALTSALSIVHPSQTLGVVETIGNNNLNAYVSNLNDSNIENFTSLFGGARNSYDVINQLNQDNQVKVYEGMDSSSFQSVYELMSDKTQSKVQGMLGQEVFDAKMVDANELSSKHQNVFKSMLNNLGFSKLNAKNFVNYSQNVTEINSCLNQNTQLTESQQSIVNAVNSNINKGLNSVINVNSTSELSTIMLSQIKDLSMVNIRINGGFVDLNGNMKSKYNSQKYIDRVTYTGYEAISIVSRIEQLQGMVDMNLPLKQRAQQIYDILASEYNYAYDYNNYTNGHSIVGSLRGLTSNNIMGKEGLVCAGFAQAYKELCERCGITCEYVRGDAVYFKDGKVKKERHAWNVVLINGEAIPVDVTWHSGSNQNWFGASKEFAETHKADADEVYINYNVVASSIDVDLASVISNHNLKYGEGQGILALNEVARTGNYNCITSMNGARETLSKYSLDQIREYVNRNNINNVNEVVTINTKIKGDIDTALVLHDMKYGLDSGRKALEALVKDGDYDRITSTNGARSIISQYSIEQINAYLNGNVVDGNELIKEKSEIPFKLSEKYNDIYNSNEVMKEIYDSVDEYGFISQQTAEMLEKLISESNDYYIGIHRTGMQSAESILDSGGVRLTGHMSSGTSSIDSVTSIDDLQLNVSFYNNLMNLVREIKTSCQYKTTDGVGDVIIYKIPKNIPIETVVNKTNLGYTIKNDYVYGYTTVDNGHVGEIKNISSIDNSNNSSFVSEQKNYESEFSKNEAINVDLKKSEIVDIYNLIVNKYGVQGAMLRIREAFKKNNFDFITRDRNARQNIQEFTLSDFEMLFKKNDVYNYFVSRYGNEREVNKRIQSIINTGNWNYLANDNGALNDLYTFTNGSLEELDQFMVSKIFSKYSGYTFLGSEKVEVGDPKINQIQELDCFKIYDEKNGTNIFVQKNLNFQYDINVLLKNLEDLKSNSPRMASAINNIYFTSIDCPANSYWAEIHANPNFNCSALGGKGNIQFFKASNDAILHNLYHETAHTLDPKNEQGVHKISDDIRWRNAVMLDDNWSSSYAEDSYSCRNHGKYSEDFADSIANLKEMGPVEFSKKYPARANILAEIVPELFKEV